MRPDHLDPDRPMIGRRGLLSGAAVVAATGALVGCESGSGGRPAAERERAVDEPHTHPTESDEAVTEAVGKDAMVVSDTKVISGEVSATAVDVRAGGVLEFDPATSTTLTVTGNVVVRGRLRMRPNGPDVVHRLQFADVDESAFVGDTMGPVASDVGLWVIGAGRLDLMGSRRRGWNRRGTHPTWQPGDEVLRAPIAVGDYDTWAEHTPGASLPGVTGPDGVTRRTEVFNLTRNVIVAGAAGKRSHVFIRSTRPQQIGYALFRWLGPRHPDTEGNANTVPVIGRYPVHFHVCEDGSRGSVVEGCVVRDSTRAFVAHASHGVTMRDCVAHRIIDDAFWWDEGTSSNDLVWQHCAVFDVRYDPDFRGTTTGFMLGVGTNMTIRNCVTVGSHGNGNNSGFHWPSFANQRPNNVWTATGLVAHNNRGDGIFVWQNDANDHLVRQVVCYRNAESGLQHGAYRNAYRYEDIVLFENGNADLRHNALAKDNPGEPRQQWTRLWAPHFVIGEHVAPSTRTIRFLDSHVDRVTVEETKPGAGYYEIHADLDPGDVDVVEQRSRITVVRPDGTRFTV